MKCRGCKHGDLHDPYRPVDYWYYMDNYVGVWHRKCFEAVYKRCKVILSENFVGWPGKAGEQCPHLAIKDFDVCRFHGATK